MASLPDARMNTFPISASANTFLVAQQVWARLSNAGGEMIASLGAESDFQRKILKKVQAN
ncbi:MAG: hypothetical protein WCK85_08425 [Chlorobium sp.]